MNTSVVKTLRKHLEGQDISIKRWAMEQGLPYQPVNNFLGGFSRGKHGKSRLVRLAVERAVAALTKE